MSTSDPTAAGCDPADERSSRPSVAPDAITESPDSAARGGADAVDAPAAAATEPNDDALITPLILNVNDDQANLYSLTRILRRGGFQVEEAKAGIEALERVHASHPDLVVLDIDLPDLDGFEVCRRIKEDPKTASIPVLHMSAKYVKQEDRVYGLGSGADGYLIQPVEQLELISSVRSLLRLRRAEASAQAKAQRIEQLEKELEALSRVAVPPSAATARVFDSAWMIESHPEIFQELVAKCEQLLDQALEQQQFKVRHDISAGLRTVADRLGFLRAAPRDVIEIYRAVLKNRTSGAVPQKARAYLEEGRLLVLELMGHLLSYYRTASMLTLSRDPPASRSGAGSSPEKRD